MDIIRKQIDFDKDLWSEVESLFPQIQKENPAARTQSGKLLFLVYLGTEKFKEKYQTKEEANE